MSDMERYLEKYIKDDLREKMVVVGGPRPVEKTTLTLSRIGLERVNQDGKPLFAVECKFQKTDLDKSLRYFRQKLDEIPKSYQVHMQDADYRIDDKIRGLPFAKFCRELSLS